MSAHVFLHDQQLVDLPALVRKTTRRKKSIVLRSIEVSGVIEGELDRLVRRVVMAWSQAVHEVVLPAYGAALGQLKLDAASDPVEQALEIAAASGSRAALGLTDEVRRWVERVDRWHASQWKSAVQSGTGIPFPFIDLKANTARISAMQARIASLIKGLDEGMRKDVQETVWKGFLEQTPRDKMGKALAERLQVGRSRANLIASDQANKTAAELTAIRQQEAGIEEFVWTTAGDDKVRPEHRALSGKRFRYDKPPSIGLPGTPIRCRCTARAYIPLEEEADEVAPPGAGQAQAAAQQAVNIERQAATARAAQLEAAEAVNATATRALAQAERRAELAAAHTAQAEAQMFAAAQAEKAVFQQKVRAAIAAEKKAKHEAFMAKMAQTKAANVVKKLKEIEAAATASGQGGISAAANLMQQQVLANPTQAASLLTKMKKQIAALEKKLPPTPPAVKTANEFLKQLGGDIQIPVDEINKAFGSYNAYIQAYAKWQKTGELPNVSFGPKPIVAAVPVTPATAPVPVGAHGGHFSQALGLEGKFQSTFGFSSQMLGKTAVEIEILAAKQGVAINASVFQKVETAFQHWKATGELPKLGDLLPPAPKPALRDPALGSVKEGTTKTMVAPKTTAEWKPITDDSASRIQNDMHDTLRRELQGLDQVKVSDYWNSYMRSGYGPLNSRLREGKGKAGGEFVKAMDQLTDRFELPEDMLLARGTRQFDGIDSAEAALGLKGQKVTDYGFFSTSSRRSTAESFGQSGGSDKPNFQITIRARKGQRVAPGTQGESEFIFPRNMEWRVLDVEVTPGRYGGQTIHLLLEAWN